MKSSHYDSSSKPRPSLFARGRLLHCVAVFGLLAASAACDSESDDLRNSEAEFTQVQVTMKDIDALEPGEKLVLDLSDEVVYEVQPKVWNEASHRVLVGHESGMTIKDWLEEIDAFGHELNKDQSLDFTDDPSRYGLSDEELTVLDEEGTISLEIHRVLCLPVYNGPHYVRDVYKHE